MVNHWKMGLDEAKSHQKYSLDVICCIACIWLYGISNYLARHHVCTLVGFCHVGLWKRPIINLLRVVGATFSLHNDMVHNVNIRRLQHLIGLVNKNSIMYEVSLTNLECKMVNITYIFHDNQRYVYSYHYTSDKTHSFSMRIHP